jgi:hypothetical protein
VADENLECFKDLASNILQDEIQLNERAKRVAGSVAISTGLIKSDSVVKLIGKPSRGNFLSIQEHLNDLESVTQDLSNTIGSAIEDSLGDVINAFGRFPDEVTDTVESNFLSVLSIFSSNKSAAYGMAKNATKKASNDAKVRIEKASDIINLINNIRQVRSAITPASGSFVIRPQDAAALSRDNLTEAKGIIQIVSKDLDTNPADRKLFTYDRALEKISVAIDNLKIGANNFKISEYLQLKAEITVAIEEFVKLDIDIDTAVKNFQRIETDYEQNKNKVGETENTFLKELLDKLCVLIDNINAVIEKDSDELAVDQMLAWSQQAVVIYALAHQVFDREIEQSIEDPDNEDKQQYDATKVVVDNNQSKATDAFLADLTSLPDLYLNFLFGKFTNAEVTAREESVKATLVQLSQEDQNLVDANSGFNPTELIILGTMLSFADRAGLDSVADAILTGNLGGLLGSLTTQFGSQASEAAACLGSSVQLVEDLEARQFLQNVNATVQGIHKNRQLAGSTRENAFKKAEEKINDRIELLQSQRNRLDNLDF